MHRLQGQRIPDLFAFLIICPNSIKFGLAEYIDRRYRPTSIDIAGIGARSTVDLTIFPASKGKYREFCLFRPVRSSQMVQNITEITMSYERIPRALEPGKIRVSSGNSVIVWQGAFIGVSWHLC
jgi:hypothetical protein